MEINAGTPLKRHSLELDTCGDLFFRNDHIGLNQTRRISPASVDCVLVSQDYVLSIQAGQEVFSIPFNPNNQEHAGLVDVLIRVLSLTPAAPAVGTV